ARDAGFEPGFFDWEPWHIIDWSPWTMSGGNAAGIEDDMTPEQSNKLNAIYAALFGNRNNTGKADPISWVNIAGDKQTSNYGVLPIVIHNQTLIAQQASRIAALEELIKKQS